MTQPTDGREALTQIAIVCTDNMDRDCDHRMALDFVRQVATDALGALTSRVEAPVPQPTTSEALAQNLEGYARDCIHIGSVESVNDLINAAAIIRDAIAAQPTSPAEKMKRWRVETQVTSSCTYYIMAANEKDAEAASVEATAEYSEDTNEETMAITEVDADGKPVTGK